MSWSKEVRYTSKSSSEEQLLAKCPLVKSHAPALTFAGNFPNYSLLRGMVFPTLDEMGFWKPFGQSLEKKEKKKNRNKKPPWRQLQPCRGSPLAGREQPFASWKGEVAQPFPRRCKSCGTSGVSESVRGQHSARLCSDSSGGTLEEEEEKEVSDINPPALRRPDSPALHAW